MMNVTQPTLEAQREIAMSNITIETDNGAPAKDEATKKPAKKNSKQPERSNKKAEVIAMMKRAGGVTPEAIMHSTGWHRHTVRGFVSILGSKGGQKIESSKSDVTDRTRHWGRVTSLRGVMNCKVLKGFRSFS
jgi:hypothetical protein